MDTAIYKTLLTLKTRFEKVCPNSIAFGVWLLRLRVKPRIDKGALVGQRYDRLGCWSILKFGVLRWIIAGLTSMGKLSYIFLTFLVLDTVFWKRNLKLWRRTFEIKMAMLHRLCTSANSFFQQTQVGLTIRMRLTKTLSSQSNIIIT